MQSESATRTTTVEQNANPTLDLDDATGILNSGRRRRAVEFLNEHREAEFGQVAEFVAEEEFGTGYSNEERKRVYVALYQSHMPKLDSYGVVEFDGTGNPVRQGPGFETTVRYLRALQRVRDEEDAGRFHTLRDLLSD